MTDTPVSDPVEIIDHEWFDWERPDGRKLPCCRKCGMIRRADGQNKPCRGRVTVGPRGDAEPRFQSRGFKPLPEQQHIDAMWKGYQALKALGWREPMYCSKSDIEWWIIEAGSTGIHRANYEGQWPTGSWWIEGDAPTQPILCKEIDASDPTKAPERALLEVK